MNLEVNFQDQYSISDIIIVHDQIKNHNFRGITVTLIHQEEENGSMSGGDFLPILSIVLGSSVTTAILAGLFDVFKEFLIHKTSKSELESKQDKITFYRKEGEVETSITLHVFDEEERKVFLEYFKNK